jgi:hypothetical protein
MNLISDAKKFVQKPYAKIGLSTSTRRGGGGALEKVSALAMLVCEGEVA